MLLDLELQLDELIDHGLQWGDVLSLTHMHLMVHSPEAREEFEDGGHPEFYYGHVEDL